jgi:outer membrane protein assembly factor BamB
VSIVAECPHCETRFNLQPDLVGKSMRCPNLDCRQVFTVQPVKPGKPSPGRNPSGSVEDFVPVVEAEAAKPAPKARPKESKPARPAKPTKAEAADFDVVEDAPVAPKEVVWSAGNAPPGAPGAPGRTPPPAKQPAKPAATTTKPARAGARPVVRPRRKKKTSTAALGFRLIALVGLVGALILGGIGMFITGVEKDEKAAAEAAKATFDKAEFSNAEKAYGELATKYPDSDSRPKYEFYAKLASLHLAAGAIDVHQNPDPAIGRWKELVERYKDSPLAKVSDEGAGRSIWDAGRKVVDAVSGHVKERLGAYKSNRSKTEDLEHVEKMIATGREVVATMASFRAPDVAPLESETEKLNQAEAEVKWERNRLKILAEVRSLLKDPTEAAVAQARALMVDLRDDPEGLDLLKRADSEFLKRIAYIPEAAAPKTPQSVAAPSLLFVTPIGTTRPTPKDAAGSEPAVFLAVARGILYAFDEDSGNQIWTARVGADVMYPPAVATLEIDGTPTELAVVASHVGGEPGLTGVVLKTGQVRWYQTLSAPAAGPAAVVGTRAFVPLRDLRGTISEVNLLTGERVGKIELGQPISTPTFGAGIAVRPGTGLLYVAAESRRVFVIDVGRKPDEPDRIAPRCVQVFLTQHFVGTIKVPPVVVDPDGAGPGGGWMILVQGDGVNAKLRAFSLPPPAGGEGPTEITPVADVELPLRGHAWFPPASDGERLAVASDKRNVQFYGVNQPGNADRAVFLLPSPPTPPERPNDDPIPGLVVPGEEGGFWVLSGGQMQKFRLALIPSRGVEAVVEGKSHPLGQPVQPAQLNRRRDAACFVVRSANSAGIRAVLVNLRDGDIRWKRQLGVIPPVAPLVGAESLSITDEDGGVFTFPPAAAEVPPGVAKPIPPEFVSVAAPENVTGPTRVAASADGKTVFTVTPVETAGTAQFVIRRIVEGKLEHSGSVTAPGALAGAPAVLGNTLIFPLSDGFIHRHVPGDGRNTPDRLNAGPRWGEERRDSSTECFITPVSATEFLTTDGGRKLTRWMWPAGGKYGAGGATWEVRERIALPPLLLPPTPGGAPARLLVADATGSVWLYPADRGGAPTRRWKPDGVIIPEGRPMGRFALQSDADGRQRVAYAVDRQNAGDKQHVVGLDVEKDTPLWVTQASPEDANREIVDSPQPAGDGRWLVTDQSGRVQLLDPQTGKPVLTKDVGLPGAIPSRAAVMVGKGRILCPLSDGSLAVIMLSEGAAEPKGDGK